MKTAKKILILTMILVMVISMLLCFGRQSISAISSITTRRAVKVGVLLNNNNVLSSLVGKSLSDIQKENENKVEFTFFNGKGDVAIENEMLNNIINSNYDLILANIVGTETQELINDSIYKAKQKNIPLIFFNITPTTDKVNVIKGYSKSLVIDVDSEEAGTLQGKMIANVWNANKETIDKNNDNIMQYIMIKGRLNRFATEARTNYSISTINNAGIKTQELAAVNANWYEEMAKNAVESLFLKYYNSIEVIIANNDAMAIGAIKALQKYGYNIGDKEKTIPIFGINQTTEAKELIRKGFMAGSVPEDPRAIAEALYVVGMNLVSGKNPIEGTNYSFDESGVVIPIQSRDY